MGEMIIATYNIASGGFTDYSSTSTKPERWSLLQEAIHSIDADIIGLTDTFRWAKMFSAAQIQHAFGYPHSLHIDMNDTRVDKRIGVTLLSRYPIIVSKIIRLHNRNAIQATIKVSSEDLLEVFVIYLDDLSEATRQRQVRALVTHLPLSGPVVILGDFNAIWPHHAHWVKGRVEDFLDTHPDFKKRPDYNTALAAFDDFYQATVLPGLEARGFAEPPEVRPTALTPLHPFGMPTIFPVDHILVKDCTASHYLVPVDDTFALASDHYPLVARIGL